MPSTNYLEIVQVSSLLTLIRRNPSSHGGQILSVPLFNSSSPIDRGTYSKQYSDFYLYYFRKQKDRIYFIFPSAVLLQLDLSLIYFHINIYCFNTKLFILVIPKTHDTLAFTGLTRESPCVCLCSSSLDV